MFSLLNVYNTHPDGTVDGYWIQDHVGDIKSARKRAKRVEEVNSNHISVVVVEHIDHPTPRLEVWTHRRVAS